MNDSTTQTPMSNAPIGADDLSGGLSTDPVPLQTPRTGLEAVREFLQVVHHAPRPDGVAPVFCRLTKAPSPGTPWPPQSGRSIRTAIERETAPGVVPGAYYLSTALSHPDSEGRHRNKKSQFAALTHLVLDDVGEKVGPNQVPPTAKIETSPGNFQWVYVLREPITDSELASAVVRCIYGAVLPHGEALTDSGGALASKYARLPVGIHGKAINGTRSLTPVRLIELHPGRLYGYQELLTAWGLSLDGGAPAPIEDAPDPVVAWLSRNGYMLKRAPQTDGGVPIKCPWKNEHSDDADTGTVVYPIGAGQYPGSVGFKCQHGHCSERTGAELTVFVLAQSGAGLADLVRLKRKDIHGLLRVAEIVSALPFIPRSHWLAVGAQLWHASRGDTEAYSLWRHWGGADHTDAQCEKQWRRLRAVPEIDARKIESLFKLARHSGWKGLTMPTTAVGVGLVWEQYRRDLKHFDAHHALLYTGVSQYVARSVHRQRIVTTNATLAGLENRYKRRRLPKIVEEKSGKKLGWSPVVKVWDSSDDRRCYDGADYRPYRGVLATTELPNEGSLNYFVGMHMKGVEGDCSLILAHLLHCWCRGVQGDYEYLLDWFARMYQEPEKPGYTALVVWGRLGSGKGLICDLLCRFWGQHAVSFSKHSSVTGRFSERLGTSSLIVMNEARLDGDEAKATLKSLITDPEITFELKFGPVVAVDNSLHLILTSNKRDAVTIEDDERRFAIFATRPPAAPKSPEYVAHFKALRAQINGAGAAAFLYFLEHRDISAFDPSELPVGDMELKAELHQHGASSLMQWWNEILSAQGPGGFGTLVLDSWPVQIQKGVVFESYAEFCREQGIRQRRTPCAVAKFMLSDVVLAGTGRASGKDHPGKRPWVYTLPSLAVARQRYDAAAGIGTREYLDAGEGDELSSGDAEGLEILLEGEGGLG